MPKGFRGTCVRYDIDVPSTSNAAITCFPRTGADAVAYFLFSNNNAMLDYYKDQLVLNPSPQISFTGEHNQDCEHEVYDEGKWGDGRLVCYATPGNSVPVVEWTSNNCSVYAFAYRQIEDKNGLTLYNWWSDGKKSGPIC